jgi:site-specific DNA-methyltransferase (adenine-specific)
MGVQDVLEGRADHYIRCGDALDRLPRLPAGSIDAIITDPPYSSGGMFRADRVNFTTDEKYTRSDWQGKRPDFHGDNMDARSWKNFTRRWMRQALRAGKDGAHLLCFTDWRQLPTLTDVIQWAGWVWRGVLVWDKTEGAKGPHTGYFGYQAEFIAWGTKGQVLRRPNLEEGGEGRMPGVYRRAVSAADKHHQTGKPTDVMRWLVRCCPPGGVVVDPFAGSGTTLVAAVQTGRRAIGFELSAEYAELARKRVHGEPLKPGETPYGLFRETEEA